MLLSEPAPRLPTPARRCNVRNMSLNRTEQALFDYIENHTEERHFWQGKVRDLMREARDDFAVSAPLAIALRLYCDERRQVGVLPAEIADHKDLVRTSFRNLAEHLMRLWGPTRPPRPAHQRRDDEIS